MSYELSDDPSADDIAALRTMAERLSQAIAMADLHGLAHLCDILERAKATVDGLLMQNPPAEIH